MCALHVRAHQTRRSGRLFRLGFNEIAQFLSKSEVLVALSVFSSQYFLFIFFFFYPIIILFLQYSHKMSSDPYRVWCSIFYSKLVNCILLRSLCSTFVLWKVREHAVVGKETLKFESIFRSSRFSLTSPLSQLREKPSRPIFIMCGEPCMY